MSPKLRFYGAWRKTPLKILSSSSELFNGSYPERGMGGRKAITGGELYVLRLKGRHCE